MQNTPKPKRVIANKKPTASPLKTHIDPKKTAIEHRLKQLRKGRKKRWRP